MDEDLLHCLSFSYFLGIGPVKFKLLKDYFKSLKKAYCANKKELEKLIGVSLTKEFIDFRNKFNPIKKLEEIKEKGIVVISLKDDRYPESLKNISDPPICIYIKGSLDIFNSKLKLSIVGTRYPTQYGIAVTKLITKELVEKNFVIVSGLAYGIDTTAHQTCLDYKGKTIAVLGCGVDICYPQENKKLYENIIQAKGAIVSEFPPGIRVNKGLFIARNRIVSGLSSGVLVIEGTEKSGTLITARYAAYQGKNVYAIPNPITSIMSHAPNLLLKEGVKVVTCVNDIIEDFYIK